MWCAGMECERYLCIANGGKTRRLPLVRESRMRRVWQTEHTAGEIQEAAVAAGTIRKIGCWPSRMFGGFSSEHFWIDGHRLRAVTKASQRGKGRAAPERGSSIAQPIVNRGVGIPAGGGS